MKTFYYLGKKAFENIVGKAFNAVFFFSPAFSPIHIVFKNSGLCSKGLNLNLNCEGEIYSTEKRENSRMVKIESNCR